MKRFAGKFLSVRTISLMVFSVIIIVPLMYAVIASLKTMKEYVTDPLGIPLPGTLENYKDLFLDYGLLGSFKNSFLFTFFTVFFVIWFSSMVSYACIRIGGWKSNLIFGFFVIGMLIPAQVNIIPLYGLIVQIEQWIASVDWLPGIQFRDTLYGLIFIKTSVLLSLSVFIITGFMKTIPRELFEAAAVDGSTESWMYTRIALPLSLPSIASSSIFLCVIVWNDLLYPLLFTGEKAKTLTMALMMFRGEYESNYPILFAGVVSASLPMVAAYLFFQRWFIAGITAGSLKG